MHGTARKMDQYLLLALIITRGLSANQRSTFGECVSAISARDSNTFCRYVTRFVIGPHFPCGVAKDQWQLTFHGRETVSPSEVRDGRSVDQNRQADGWCVSASSHAIGLLYCVLVTKVIVVSTADTGLCTVFSSLVVAPSILLLLLLSACRWLLDSLPARHTLTSPPLHCEHGDQVNRCTSARRFCASYLCVLGVDNVSESCVHYRQRRPQLEAALGCVVLCLTHTTAGWSENLLLLKQRIKKKWDWVGKRREGL